MFCRNLKKRIKNQRKCIQDERKCNVVTPAEECRDITLEVKTTAEECRNIMAMSRHWKSNVATSEEQCRDIGRAMSRHRMKEAKHRNSESRL